VEESEFYTRVRDAYLGVAAREPERFRVIDAQRPADAIHADVMDMITGFLQ